LTVDGTPPGAPTITGGSSDSSGNITVTWSPSSDTLSGVAGYQVVRNNAVIGSTAGTSYADTGTTAGTTYSYQVAAVDGAGNVSAHSAPVSVTASSGKGGGGKGGGARKK
jgi:chitodextrinase